jgi:hypothetical protein
MPTSTYTPIATNTLTSAATTVTFSSIPSTYTDLVLVTNITDVNTYDLLRVNGDAGNNYSRTYAQGNGSLTGSGRGANESSNYVLAGVTITNFMNYSNTSTFKSTIQSASNPSADIQMSAFLWRSTAAINSISIISPVGSATMAAGSTFTLYGIKAA